MSLKELRQRSEVTGELIYPGQILNLSSLKPSPKIDTATTYTVQKGDSLWGVATVYGVTLDNLIKWNKLDSSTIYPNQKLIINPIKNVTLSKPFSSFPIAESSQDITTTPLPSPNLADIITPGPGKVNLSGNGIVTSPPKGESGALIEVFPLPVLELRLLLNQLSHFENGWQLKPNITYNAG